VNQTVIKSILGAEYEIHTAMDGEEALEYLRSPPEGLPDLVLLDVMMPGMSGFEVCRHVRQEMELPPTSLPILLLSACASASVVNEGLDSGCNSFVSKPFDRLVLRALVKSALQIKRLHEKEVAVAVSLQKTQAPAPAGKLKGAEEEQGACNVSGLQCLGTDCRLAGG